MNTMKTGAELIQEERQRQMEKEGWSPDHDDSHDMEELASAAFCYLRSYLSPEAFRHSLPSQWPWSREEWKPDGTVKDLVKAGALIAAEIDRLQRKENS